MKRHLGKTKTTLPECKHKGTDSQGILHKREADVHYLPNKHL